MDAAIKNLSLTAMGCMGKAISIGEHKVNFDFMTCLTFSAFYPLDGPVAYHSLKLR